MHCSAPKQTKPTNQEEAKLSSPRTKELLAATKDLLDQLQGIGIYIPGVDEGNWHEAEGLSFSRIEKAVGVYEIPQFPTKRRAK